MNLVPRVPGSQLPPWDQAPFWQPVREADFTVNLGVQRIADSNPSRTGLIISYTSGAGQIEISTVNQTPLRGILLNDTAPVILLTHNQFGPLVTCEWYMSAGNIGDRVHVVEVLLAKWPGE